MAFTRPMQAVAVAVCCGALFGCTPQPTASRPPATVTPGPSPTPPVSPSASPTLSAEQQDAVAAVQDYYDVFNKVMTRASSPNDLATVSRRGALAEAQTTYNTFANASLTVEGSVTASVVAVGLPKEGTRVSVVVAVCDDARDWKVLDESGKDIVKSSAKVVRPLNVTTQKWPEDGWFVTTFTKGTHSC